MAHIEKAALDTLQYLQQATAEMGETDRMRTFLYLQGLCSACTHTELREMLDKQDAINARYREAAERSVAPRFAVGDTDLSHLIKSVQVNGREVYSATYKGRSRQGSAEEEAKVLATYSERMDKIEHIRERLLAHGYKSFYFLHGKREYKLGFSKSDSYYAIASLQDVSILHALGVAQNFDWLDKPTAEEKRLLREAKAACDEKEAREAQARYEAEAEQEKAQARSIARRAQACGFLHVRPRPIDSSFSGHVVFLEKATTKSAPVDSVAGLHEIRMGIIRDQDFDAIFAPREQKQLEEKAEMIVRNALARGFRYYHSCPITGKVSFSVYDTVSGSYPLGNMDGAKKAVIGALKAGQSFSKREL